MSETDYLESRIRELADRAYKNEYTVNTEFLSISEQASFYEALKKLGVPADSDRVFGVRFTLQGGYDDAERRAAFFLPSWLDTETFIRNEQTAPDLLTCLHISPLQKKFSDPLTHRDYLGALMSLGIERDRTGDILIDHEDHSAYIFIFKNIAEIVCRELVHRLQEIVARRVHENVAKRSRSVLKIFKAVRCFIDASLEPVERLGICRDVSPVSVDHICIYKVNIADEGVLSSTKKGRDFIRVRVFK